MAEDLSITSMIGRLTRDLDLQYTGSGFAIGTGSIAVNAREKHGDQWEDETSFFDIKLLGKRAESLAQYMGKGVRVAVQGRLKQERWQDRQSNAQRSKVVLMVHSVQLLGESSNTGDPPQNNQGHAQRPFRPTPQQPPRQPDDADFDSDIPF